MYEVLITFTEKNHEKHLYKKGESYPAKGYKATKKRVNELQNDNKYNKVFLGEEIKAETEAKAKVKKSDSK